MMRDGRILVVRACVTTILVAFLSTWVPRAEGGQDGQVTVGGKVLDAAGRPVEGARVRLYQERSAGVSSEAEMTLTGDVTVGPDGTYAFKVPAETDAYRYGYLFAEKAGLAIGVASGAVTRDRTFDLTLGEPTPLAGVIVDEDGGPVPDASVGIYILILPTGQGPQAYGLSMNLASKLLTTRTDVSGRFAFTNLPAGANAELVVQKPGRALVCTFDPASSGSDSSRYPAGRTDIRLVQPVEARIEGTIVRKGTAEPVSGVTLAVQGGVNRPLDGYDRIKPRSDGVFVAPGLPAGEYILRLVNPGGQLTEWVANPVPIALERGQTRTGVKIEVDKGGILEVSVSDGETSGPVEKASVSVRDLTSNQWSGGETDANGIARIRLTAGSYQVEGAYKRGYYYEGQFHRIAIAEGTVKRLEMTVHKTPTIRGVARDSDGRPVSGATVAIFPMSREEATTDSAGAFEIIRERNVGVRSGQNESQCLVIRHEERNLVAAVEIGEETPALDVKLESGVLLIGRVTDPAGKGIAAAQIRPSLRVGSYGSSFGGDQLRTNADGRFEIRAAPAGRKYSLYVSADGYGSKSNHDVDTTSAVGGRLDAGVFELPVADLAVSGQVVNAESRPVANATLRIYGDGQPTRMDGRADAEGRFTLQKVCAGPLTIQVDAIQGGKSLSARAMTEGGSTDIRIIAREGRSAVFQRVGGKGYEQIVATAAKVIAGFVADRNGSPVAGVPVRVCCHKTLRDGRPSWTYSSFAELSATTDARGRFAIEIREDGEYNLLFSPDKFAAIIVYDIPVGTKDLKVTLLEGGTVAGRLVRVEKGQEVPIPHAEVKVEQTDRSAFSHLGFDRDRTVTTDGEGRFRFEHLSTLTREDRNKSEFIPRSWRISYGETAQTILFDKGDLMEDFELVVRPDPAKAASLAGSPLPGFDGVRIDLSAERIKDKRVLVCFFDWEQRPSRSCVMQLAQQAEALKAKGVAIAAVSVSTGDDASLQAWAKQNQIPFPVGAIQGDKDEVLFTWSVKSLPWLILAGSSHAVTAEGFGPAELTQKLEEPVAKP